MGGNRLPKQKKGEIRLIKTAAGKIDRNIAGCVQRDRLPSEGGEANKEETAQTGTDCLEVAESRHTRRRVNTDTAPSRASCHQPSHRRSL